MIKPNTAIFSHFANVNHARIRSWNQQELSNKGSFLLNETMEAFNGF